MGELITHDASIRAAGTHWGSDYKSLLNVSHIFDLTMDVLELLELGGEALTITNDAISQIAYLGSFNFAFTLQLIINIITHDLSQDLQKKTKILRLP